MYCENLRASNFNKVKDYSLATLIEYSNVKWFSNLNKIKDFANFLESSNIKLFSSSMAIVLKFW